MPTTLTAQEAQNIALEAYIYFYPLVIMDVTRKHFTNIEADKKFGRGPMNTFTHARTFPPATFRGATHPNFDTLYSLSWLDLTKGPVVISVPDTHGRYYLLQMLDMWTNTFAGVGKRTTGTDAGNFVVVDLAGRVNCPKVFSEFTLRRRSSGSLAEPGPTGLRITMPYTKCRMATKLPCSRSGAVSRSRSRPTLTRPSTWKRHRCNRSKK